jgi:hypothetical protein
MQVLMAAPGYDRLLHALADGDLPAEGAMATVRRLIGMAKLLPAVALLREELEADPYHKVVVMAYHRDIIAALYNALQPYWPVRVWGATPALEREQAEHVFQNTPECRVFIGQTTAAGQAITLTAANDIVIVEPAWSPEDLRQAVKRIHRIGQTRACRARICVLPDTIDEAVESTRLRKLRDLGEIIHL